MTGTGMPRREAGIALVLLVLLAAALLLAPSAPGPGPLPLVAGLAAAHAALLAPALARGGAAWGMLPALLALPALAACSYGRSLPGAVLLVALCALAGSAQRARPARLYLPGMLLVFLAPYALHYLVIEFGGGADGRGWLRISPLVAAGETWPSAVCVLCLLFWPVLALARRGA